MEIRFDYRDIRVLRVYTLTGEYLGEVRAPRPWQRYAHGVKTRQYIHKYCSVNKRKMKDPLSEFFWLQLQRKNQPKAALEIVRLYREYTAFPPKLFEEQEETVESKDDLERWDEDAEGPRSTIKKWSTEMANIWDGEDED